MKRIGLMVIMGCLFLNISNAQSLTEQIEQAYNRLDSASYIDNIIQSYAKCLDNRDKETYDLLVKMLGSGSDSISVIRAKNRVDSMYPPNYFQSCKITNARYLKEFENSVKSGTPLYVLNLRLKDGQTLQVDTSKLAFNLYYFGKRYKGRLYIYCDEGECGYDSYYRTFSRKLGKNAPKVFRKIMRKHPKYLLFCRDLVERMNSILYVIGNDIYIYRIIQMQEYKLDDYMENRKRLSRN